MPIVKPCIAIVYCNGVEEKRQRISDRSTTLKDRMKQLRRLHESVRKVAERYPHHTYHIDLIY
jgi:hypothetical protein